MATNPDGGGHDDCPLQWTEAWTRRQFLGRASSAAALVAIGGALEALEACGTSSPSASPTPLKQDLVVGVTADSYSTTGSAATLGIFQPNTGIGENLAALTPSFGVKPMLAERWEFRAPDTYRFFLRKGVVFHDGQPLTAQAVKATLFDVIATQGGQTIKSGPQSAVVVDDLTIDFTPKITNFRVIEQIVHPQFPVIAPGTVVGNKPVGTGPYRFVEYTPGQSIVVERNPNYWGPKAKLRQVTFRFYPDSETRHLALQSGDIDIAFDVPRPDVASLKQRGIHVVTSSPGAYLVMFACLHGSAPYDILQDAQVRQAVSYAVDRQKLVSGVLNGLATTDQTMVPRQLLGRYASTVKGFAYDPAKAKSMLDAAGWTVGSSGTRAKGGRQLKLTLVSGYPSPDLLRPVPEFIQSQLGAVGISVQIVEQADSASFRNAIKAMQGDLFLEQRSQNDADPSFLPAVFLSNITEGGSAAYQAAFNPGAAFNSLMRSTLTEMDVDRVRDLVAQAMHEEVDVQAGVIALAGIYYIYGLRGSISGFVPYPAQSSTDWDPVAFS